MTIALAATLPLPAPTQAMAHLFEPQAQGRHGGHTPALGKHPGLGLPCLFGFVLRPMPARRLRSMFGVQTSMSAKILPAAEAAGRLAEAIEDVRLLVPGTARHERCSSWLRLAARLPENFAPLLFEPSVRVALLAAVGSGQPVEHAYAA